MATYSDPRNRKLWQLKGHLYSKSELLLTVTAAKAKTFSSTASATGLANGFSRQLIRTVRAGGECGAKAKREKNTKKNFKQSMAVDSTRNETITIILWAICFRFSSASECVHYAFSKPNNITPNPHNAEWVLDGNRSAFAKHLLLACERKFIFIQIRLRDGHEGETCVRPAWTEYGTKTHTERCVPVSRVQST